MQVYILTQKFFNRFNFNCREFCFDTYVESHFQRIVVCYNLLSTLSITRLKYSNGEISKLGSPRNIFWSLYYFIVHK